MSERQIDEAIDEAVRDLMNVDADPTFRGRVVERLRTPKTHPPLWRQLSLVAGAVGVAVIGVVLMRNMDKPAIEPRRDPVQSAAAPQPAIEPRVAQGPAPAPIVTRLPVQRAARRRAGNPTLQISPGALIATVADEAPAPLPAGGVESLGHITPIELTPIAPAPIITTEIAIAPLAPPSELVIVPLQRERE